MVNVLRFWSRVLVKGLQEYAAVAGPCIALNIVNVLG